MYTAGAAVAVVSLVVGVGVAFAATASHHHKHHPKVAPPKPKVVFLKCAWSESTVPPQGQANVDQPPDNGDTYGPADCGGWGAGTVHTVFNVPDNGDTVGTYTMYLSEGTMSGSFDVSPNEAPPLSDTGFYSQTFTGTVKLARGTGLYQGVKGQKVGVMNCSTADSDVHMTCVARLKAVVPPGTDVSTGAGGGTGTGTGTGTGPTGPSGPTGPTG
jgi:hypothetical protein